MTTPSQENKLQAHSIPALTATQIVTKLGQLNDWKLHGDGTELCIEKTFFFDEYLQVISFVNAVAYIAERTRHHPDILLRYDGCNVRFRSHDVQGLSSRDFECAILVDGLCNTTED